MATTEQQFKEELDKPTEISGNLDEHNKALDEQFQATINEPGEEALPEKPFVPNEVLFNDFSPVAEEPLEDVVTNWYNVFQSDLPTVGKKHGDIMAGQTLAISDPDVITQQDLVMSLNEGDKYGAKQKAFTDKLDRKEKEIIEALGERPVGSSEELLKESIATQQLIAEEVTAVAESPTGYEHELVDSLAPIDVSELMAKEWELQFALSNTAFEIQDRGFGDKVLDVLDLSLPLSHKNLVDRLLSSEKTEDVFGFSPQDLPKWAAAWDSIPLERRAILQPLLMESIREAAADIFQGGENEEQVVRLINVLTSPDTVAAAEALDELGLAETIIGSLDALAVSHLLGYTVGVATRRLRKDTSIPWAQYGMGNKEKAADTTIAALLDDKAADASGMSRQTAMDTSMPVGIGRDVAPPKGPSSGALAPLAPLPGKPPTVISGNEPQINPGYIPGLSPEIEEKLNTFARERTGPTVFTFSEESNALKHGLLHKPEREAFVADNNSELTAGTEIMLADGGIYVDNVTAISTSPKGISIYYEMTDKNSGEKIASSDLGREIRWTLDDVTGNYVQTVKSLSSAGNLTSNFFQPTFWARSAGDEDIIKVDFFDESEVSNAIESLQEASRQRIINLVSEAQLPVAGVANTNSRKRVADVLVAGDQFQHTRFAERGKVYSVHDLTVKGIEDVDGNRVFLRKPNEIESYFKTLMVGEALGDIDDAGRRFVLQSQNMQEVRFRGDRTEFGKPFESSQAVARSADMHSVRLHNGRSGSVEDYNSKNIARLYDEGMVVVRMIEPQMMPKGTPGALDGEFVDHFIVNKNDLLGLPERVMNRKVGWVPKINKRVEFLLKEVTNRGRLNGQQHSRLETLAFASNKADADALLLREIDIRTKRIMNNTALSLEEKSRQIQELSNAFRVVRDRDQTDIERIQEETGASSGLRTRARSRKDISYGLNGNAPERESPWAAMARHGQQVSNFNMLNPWRLGSQKRWLNTYDLTIGSRKPGDTFQNILLNKSKPEHRALEKMRDQINVWNGMRNQEEHAYEASLQLLHDWVLRGGRKVTSTIGFQGPDSVPAILSMKHASPAALAKSIAFTTALGLLNVNHLFLQASGAVVGASLWPTRFPEASMYATQMAWLAQVDKFQRKQLDVFTRAAMEAADVPRLKEVYSAYMRTGLDDSVGANPDAETLNAGFGMSPSTLIGATNRKLGVFYQAGEKFNRRSTFAMAYLEIRDTVGRALTKEEILERVLPEANRALLNLGRNNKAWFQGGTGTGGIRQLVSISTQFAQVGWKTMEAVGKGKKTNRGAFTPAQKVRVAGAQFGAYGLAGIPLSGALVVAMSELSGVDEKDINPELAAGIEGGMTGFATKILLGAEVEAASRFSLFKNVEDYFMGFMTGQSEVGWKMLGAFGGSVDKISKAFTRGMIPIMDSIESDRTLTSQDYAEIFAALAQIPTSTRNLWKANVMEKFHVIQTAKGQIVGTGPFNPQTEFMTAMGFVPSKEAIVRNEQQKGMRYEAMVKEYVDLYKGLIQQYAIVDGWTDEAREDYHKIDVFLARSLDPYTISEVRARVASSLQNPKTIEDQVKADWLKRVAIDPATDALIDPADNVPMSGFFDKLPMSDIQDLGTGVESTDPILTGALTTFSERQLEMRAKGDGVNQ